MRHLVLIVLVFCVCGCAQVVTIRAPTDGYVVSIADRGSEYKAGIAPSQVLFDALRCEQNGASNWRTEATISIYGTCDSAVAQKISVAKNTEKSLIVHIRSDALEIQTEQEYARLEIAKEKLQEAENTFKFEKETMLKLDIAAQDTRNTYLSNQAAYTQHAESPYFPQNERQIHWNDTRAWIDASSDQFKTRANRKIETEFPERVAIAKKEVKIGKFAIDLLDAAKRVGELMCPTGKCRVLEVYAVKGQYVSKGDPLLKVRVATDVVP